MSRLTNSGLAMLRSAGSNANGGTVATSVHELAGRSGKLTRFDDRMDAKQDRLQKQFTAMEAALSASQSAGSSLAGLISSNSSN